VLRRPGSCKHLCQGDSSPPKFPSFPPWATLFADLIQIPPLMRTLGFMFGPRPEAPLPLLVSLSTSGLFFVPNSTPSLLGFIRGCQSSTFLSEAHLTPRSTFLPAAAAVSELYGAASILLSFFQIKTVFRFPPSSFGVPPPPGVIFGLFFAADGLFDNLTSRGTFLVMAFGVACDDFFSAPKRLPFFPLNFSKMAASSHSPISISTIEGAPWSPPPLTSPFSSQAISHS